MTASGPRARITARLRTPLHPRGGMHQPRGDGRACFRASVASLPLSAWSSAFLQPKGCAPSARRRCPSTARRRCPDLPDRANDFTAGARTTSRSERAIAFSCPSCHLQQPRRCRSHRHCHRQLRPCLCRRHRQDRLRLARRPGRPLRQPPRPRRRSLARAGVRWRMIRGGAAGKTRVQAAPAACRRHPHRRHHRPLHHRTDANLALSPRGRSHRRHHRPQPLRAQPRRPRPCPRRRVRRLLRFHQDCRPRLCRRPRRRHRRHRRRRRRRIPRSPNIPTAGADVTLYVGTVTGRGELLSPVTGNRYQEEERTHPAVPRASQSTLERPVGTRLVPATKQLL